jgi:hypothetical protein
MIHVIFETIAEGLTYPQAVGLVAELLALDLPQRQVPTCPSCGSPLHARREVFTYYPVLGLEPNGSPILGSEPHLHQATAEPATVVCLLCGESNADTLTNL